MKKTLLNYHIIIEKEQQPDKSWLYVSHVPTLGLSDFGETIEQAVKNTEDAIKVYIETLAEHGDPVPSPDVEDFFITNKRIEIESTSSLQFA